MELSGIVTSATNCNPSMQEMVGVIIGLMVGDMVSVGINSGITGVDGDEGEEITGGEDVTPPQAVNNIPRDITPTISEKGLVMDTDPGF